MTFLGGLYFFLHFILPESVLQSVGISAAHESISNGFIAIGAMAVGLGIINITLSHGSKFIFRRQGWIFSLTLLFGLLAMIGTTFCQWLYQQNIAHEIQKVQIISDFAVRIVEDAQSVPGRQKSFSPNGILPPLSQRIEALKNYVSDVCNAVRKECATSAQGVQNDASLRILIDELAQSIHLVEVSHDDLSRHSWGALDGEGEAILKGIGGHAAKMSSAYALVKRDLGARSLINKLYDFLYNGLFNNLGSAMFALLGVYIAAAAYRAFRIQSLESALMMAAALVVMLGQISFGKAIYEDMPAVRQWLLEVPNSAAFRAIRLGAAVAGLILAIRMWLSIESSSDRGQS
jgi:hypothetical protein